MAYHAELHTDFDTKEVNYYDAHAFVAQLKKLYPDHPLYADTMSCDEAHLYIEEMQQEIHALLLLCTWTQVDKSAVPPNPDGTARKILKGT